MNFPDFLLPVNLLWAANVLMAVVLGYALRTACWRHLQSDGLLHVFFGSIVTLMLIWSVRAGIRPGLDFHLLGGTLLALMFGWRLALCGLAVTLLGVTLFSMAGWQSLGINFLLMAALPVAFSYTLYYWVDRKLPNHLFIYIFICGFAGAGIAITLCGVLATFILSEGGAYTRQYLVQNYFPYYIFMAWSEALLTGMAVTLMAAFRPEWLVTFSDRRYLNSKR
jgi:uncharacterized membrane protein